MNAYQYSIRLLSIRDYSQKKLIAKLEEKSFTPEEIEEAIKILIEKNYIREDEYKKSKARYYLRRGLSPQFIERKLSTEVDISQEEIMMVANEASISVDDNLKALINKKIKGQKLSELDYDSRTKLIIKTKRYLLSKGYSYDQINVAMRNLES